MKRFVWLHCILFVGLVCCASPESAEESTGTGVATEAEAEALADDSVLVREVAGAWDSAVNTEDLDAFMALHHYDVVRLNAGGPALIGADAAREDFRQRFENTQIEESTSVLEVQVAGGWAFAHGIYESREEGSVETGKWVSIFRKTPDGWKYAVDIWNRDAPLETSAPTVERPSPQLPVGSVADEVEAVMKAWDAGLVAGDVDELVGLYTNDARRMNADEPTHVGLDGVRADFESDLKTPYETAEGIIHGGATEGDWSYAWAPGPSPGVAKRIAGNG